MPGSNILGKNCACCPPPECCMYPGPDPDGYNGGPFYPPEDAPAEMALNGITCERGTASEGSSVLSDYSYGYGNPFDPDHPGEWAQLYPANDGVQTVWFVNNGMIGGGVTLQIACLCGEPATEAGVSDLFASTYAVSTGGMITRGVFDTCCTWSGGSNVLTYDSETYKWKLNDVDKDDNQDSPVGTYGGVTVS